MVRKRSKSYNALDDYREVSTWAAKILILTVAMIGLGFTVLLYSYKMYMDTIVEDYMSQNILLAQFIEGIPQNDTRILEYIRTNHLWQPSEKPYNWSGASVRPGYNAVNTQVRKALGKLENGFFVEARAGDGQSYSNTRALEVNHGWHGILIEPLPTKFQVLRSKHRKAWLVNSCLSAYPYPSTKAVPGPANFSISEPERSLLWTFYNIQCFPLYSILAAVNVSMVDYLSLDLDGSELEVLKTVPFDSVTVKVISVRYARIPEGGDVLRDFMTTKGYSLIGEGDSQYIFKLQPNVTKIDEEISPQSMEIEDYESEEGEEIIIKVAEDDETDDPEDSDAGNEDVSIEPNN